MRSHNSPAPASLCGARREMLVLRLPLPKQEARTKRSRNEQRNRYDDATSSNPPRIGAANTVAPYLAANQFSIDVSEAALSICACDSAIMPGETGRPTWLHSSSIWPHPQVQIKLCPTLSNRDVGFAPSMTPASTQTMPACANGFSVMRLADHFPPLHWVHSRKDSPCIRPSTYSRQP